jgi:two-component system, NarL family, nitrate/nitrite response regulator NarL
MANGALAIIDECPILLDALCGICTSNGFDVVGRGKSKDEALALACKNIDALVLDPTMQGGIEVISKILVRCPQIKIVALSSASGADYAVRAIEAGARGYVLKKCTAEDFIQAIRAVMDGDLFVSPTFAAKILTSLRDARLRKRAAQIVNFNTREHQVVRLLLRGRTNKEIARTLSIGEKTVKWYMTNVMQKLNARSRTEAVLACHKLGLVPDQDISNIDATLV